MGLIVFKIIPDYSCKILQNPEKSCIDVDRRKNKTKKPQVKKSSHPKNDKQTKQKNAKPITQVLLKK